MIVELLLMVTHLVYTEDVASIVLIATIVTVQKLVNSFAIFFSSKMNFYSWRTKDINGTVYLFATGYKGQRCEIDINECEEVNYAICGDRGRCKNEEGSYRCECDPSVCGIHCDLYDPCVVSILLVQIITLCLKTPRWVHFTAVTFCKR